MSLLKPDTKRLFFALCPDDAVREQLVGLRAKLDLTGGRPVHRADLHITLQYLGQMTAAQQACVESAASRVASSAFSLTIAQVRYWRRSRLLWAGLDNNPDALKALVRRLGEQLQLCGIEPDQRAYQPHVTLARNILTQVNAQSTDRISWDVREFVLLESHTDGRMPRYAPVARFSLNY